MVKNLTAVWEIWVQSLGWEDPLEEGMATHLSIFAWRIPMDRGTWEVTVTWGRKELDMTERLSTNSNIWTYSEFVSTDSFLKKILSVGPTLLFVCLPHFFFFFWKIR